jgi:hypothetical protein
MDVILATSTTRATKPEQPAFYLLNISSKLGPEYVHMFDDFMRMMSIQMTLQFMMFIGGSTDALISADFVLILFYVLIGVALYWLVLRKVIGFR